MYLVVLLFGLRATNSKQGYLVLIFGIGTVSGILLWKIKRNFGIAYGFLAGIGLFTTTIGLLNKGPLASVLYGNTISARGDSWRAGWSMASSNPFFGVGLDSYGDWYLRKRDLISVSRSPSPAFNNASHNVFLDFSSSGGVTFFLIYCSFIVLVLISAYKVFTRSTELNPLFVGVFGAWIGYQAQSIISINQITLASWSWIMSGLLIGYEINRRSAPSEFNPVGIGERINDNILSPPICF
jgi:O-antigen ligase